MYYPDIVIATPTTFKTQLLLGWEALLFGCIASPLIISQQCHYTSLKSRKTGVRWGIQLVDKLWNIIYQLWTHRNKCLHDTEIINQNSGRDQLKTAIIHEHALGIKTSLQFMLHTSHHCLPSWPKPSHIKRSGS